MGDSLSDVRCRVVRSWCGSSNTFGGADYTGELMSKVPLRITDRMNRDAGTTPATVGDISVLANVSCSQTADASLGSTCALDTSVNAIIPGAVVTGERAIWETGQIEVLDAGP